MNVGVILFKMPARLTREQFILKARQIHGWKYDYSKVVYVNSHTSVCIICPIHGEFWQKPYIHLTNHGCSKCGIDNVRESKIKSNDVFLLQARNTHGDAYEYLDPYINSQTPIRTRCKKHDYIFTQNPSSHLQRRGCPICGREIVEASTRLTLEEFIRRSNIVHNNKYDYTPSEYIDGKTKTTIICPIHGPFEQKPSNHLAGHGCPKCAPNYPYSREDFIELASKTHNYKYDYSEVEWVNMLTDVTIICSIHGRYIQKPYHHVRGVGCPKCGIVTCHEKLMLSNEEFISRSIKTHGYRFDYSKSNYNNSQTKVCIICHEKDANGIEHGEFWQTPANHISGQGCPRCNESKGERTVALWLDSHNIRYERQFIVTSEQVLFGRNRFAIDFYLPNYNTFIEFHGKQHYERVEAWHTEEQFQDQQDRDRRLREYCKQHKIRLIEIPYTKINNIDKILNLKLLNFKIK